MLQATLDQLARLRIQHRNLLVARVQITTYNLHVLGSFPPSPGSFERTKSTRAEGSRHGYLIRRTYEFLDGEQFPRGALLVLQSIVSSTR